jgi:hypothetical protein
MIINYLDKDFEYQLRFALSILSWFKQKQTSTEVILHVFLANTHHQACYSMTWYLGTLSIDSRESIQAWKSWELLELSLGERLPTDYMNDFASRKTFSHALQSGNAHLIMLTQNSKTESEYSNLTPESRSGETRIKSVCLNKLDRIKCTLKDGFVASKHGGWLRLMFAFVRITLKRKERIVIATHSPCLGHL